MPDQNRTEPFAPMQRRRALGLVSSLPLFGLPEVPVSLETLRIIAQELVRTVRANVTIDWTLRDNVRAQLRVLVKRILRKYKYPPDQQEEAVQLVLAQAESLCVVWC